MNYLKESFTITNARTTLKMTILCHAIYVYVCKVLYVVIFSQTNKCRTQAVRTGVIHIYVENSRLQYFLNVAQMNPCNGYFIMSNK